MGRILGLHGGYGGFGTEVRAWLERSVKEATGIEFSKILLIDDFIDQIPPETVSHLNVVSRQEFLAESKQHELFFNVLIGDAKARKTIWQFYEENGVAPANLISHSADVNCNRKALHGSVFCQNTILTSASSIGKGCHFNIYSYVAHDCVIGDFVTFAPRASCNGHIVIEDGAYIGTGAILRDGKRGSPLKIGAGAIVGMGAVVTKDVAAGTTVIGNPAKVLQR